MGCKTLKQQKTGKSISRGRVDSIMGHSPNGCTYSLIIISNHVFIDLPSLKQYAAVKKRKKEKRNDGRIKYKVKRIT